MPSPIRSAVESPLMRTSRQMALLGASGLALWLLAAIGWSLQWPSQRVGLLAGLGAGFVVGYLLYRLQPRWWREQCDEESATPAARRYFRAMWIAMSVYSLLVVASLALLKQLEGPLALRALVAVSPVAGMVMFAQAMLRYLREVDEMQRRIETEAIATSAAVVPLLYFAAGFLQQARVIDVPAGVAMIWVFPLSSLVYGVAKFFVTRRYR